MDLEVGVIIADVPISKKTNTPLEKEAYNRANSVYLVIGLFRCFPDDWSNGLVSLRPNEDKVDFACFIRKCIVRKC